MNIPMEHAIIFVIMAGTYFTQAEADAKIGRTVFTNMPIEDVPAGVIGKITGKKRLGYQKYEIRVTFDKDFYQGMNQIVRFNKPYYEEALVELPGDYSLDEVCAAARLALKLEHLDGKQLLEIRNGLDENLRHFRQTSGAVPAFFRILALSCEMLLDLQGHNLREILEEGITHAVMSVMTAEQAQKALKLEHEVTDLILPPLDESGDPIEVVKKALQFFLASGRTA